MDAISYIWYSNFFFFLSALHYLNLFQVHSLFKLRVFFQSNVLPFLIIHLCLKAKHYRGFPGSSVVKNPPANPGDARHTGVIPELGGSVWGGNGNPLQYSCWKNPMDKGAWQATVHGVTESDRTVQLSTHTQELRFPARWCIINTC